MENIKTLIKKKPFLLLIPIFFIIIVISLIVLAINYNQTTEIELVVAPASATTMIDGKEYQNGSYRFSNGEHNVKISKEGFTTKEFSFNTNNTTKVYAYIEQSDGSMSWYLSHEDDAVLLTKIGSYEADKAETNYDTENPIITKFPIIYANYDEELNYTEFRIDAGTFDDCKTSFCIKVTDTTGNNLENAKKLLEETGIDPTKYQIIYQYTPIEELN